MNETPVPRPVMDAFRAMGAFACIVAQSCAETLEDDDVQRVKQRLGFLVQAIAQAPPEVDGHILTGIEVHHICSLHDLFVESVESKGGLEVRSLKSN